MDAPPDLFPHRRPRKGQAEFLADAREAVRRGGVLLAQAPTGLGKTAVALTAAAEGALAKGKRVLFATPRRSQHRVAIETLRRMTQARRLAVADVVARDAMCGDHAAHVGGRGRVASVAQAVLRRPLHVQKVVDLAARYRVCPHAVARQAARGADVVVCDYNYVFGPHRERILRALDLLLEDVLLVVDEAHNLPSRGRDALSAAMTAEGLERVASVLRPGEALRAASLTARLLREESRVVGGDSRVPPDFLDRLLTRGLGRGASHPATHVASLLAREGPGTSPELVPLMEEVVTVLRKWRRPDVLRLLSRRGGGALSLLALDPRPATEEVFQRVAAGLLMSGTLHPGHMYVDLLGVPADRSRVRAYLPAFPPEHRLLVASRTLSSSYRDRPESYQGYTRAVAQLCRVVPGNLACFFPSYDVARAVGRGLLPSPPKPLLWERRGQSREAKEALLRALERGQRREGNLLLAVQGASLSEGVDYPGDLLRAVVVAGLALSPPQLEVEALRAFYARRFGRRRAYEYAYVYPALHKMVQCAGRCIRGPEDVGAVILLDRRVLQPYFRARLPEGFQPLVPRDLVGRVRGFFYGGPRPSRGADQAGRGGGPARDDVAGTAGGGEGPRAERLPPPPAG